MDSARSNLTPEEFYDALVETLDVLERGWDDLYDPEDVREWVYDQWPIDAPTGSNLIWWARSCVHDLEVQRSELWEDGSGYVQRRRA